MMKIRDLIVLLLLVTAINGCDAQNLLDFEWKFKTGDDMAWASSDFDDSGWDLIQAGKDWENQGFGTYDGYAWYRQTVVIPSSLKKEADKRGGFVLRLGQIDDSDEAYWNGELIGKSGGMPPDYETGYSIKREYMVPMDKIRWGEENTIAVRVYDGGGGGGIIAQPVSLAVIGLEQMLVIKAEMEREDQLFLEEGPVKFGVVVENKMKETLKGTMELVLTSDFGDCVFEKSLEAKVKGRSTKKIAVDLGELAPGFYSLEVLIKGDKNRKKTVLALGVRPEEIVSPLDRPDDFDNYWMRAKRELAAVDPQFKLTLLEDESTETREVYLLEMRSLGNVLIRGFYGRPKAEGVYPAMLHVQGYSSVKNVGTLYQGDDMVSLALNIRGHGNSTDHVNPGFPGYILSNIDDPEMYIYRGAYMDCIRAVDFLFTRDEVDQSRVAVEGGSQGGALSFATAALDNERITLCVPHVPFLSDFKDYFKVAAWPGGEVFTWLENHPEVSEEEVYHTLSYIDIKNLAPWIKAPVYMTVGLKDKTCPPHINFAAYNQLNVEKSYYAFPESGHGMPGVYYSDMLYKIIRKYFGME